MNSKTRKEIVAVLTRQGRGDLVKHLTAGPQDEQQIRRIEDLLQTITVSANQARAALKKFQEGGKMTPQFGNVKSLVHDIMVNAQVIGRKLDLIKPA